MKKILGIRREDKNRWERRVPLIPADIEELGKKYGIKTFVQPSPIRVFKDTEYTKAGAQVSEDMSAADVIFAVKEIPEELFARGKTYVFFSHTIKGQHHNMNMLKRLMDLECNLIDYERVVNEKNIRLIFFGRHAGLSGMIETLHAFGRKMSLKGMHTPFEEVKQAYLYDTLQQAKEQIQAVGAHIAEKGLPEELCPLVVGFSGYGNVSRGAQEIFDLLPHKVVEPKDLAKAVKQNAGENRALLKVVFKEEDMVKPKSGVFELQDYYNHPEKYESSFESHLPVLKMLVNCIYWSEKYPRLVTKEYLKREYARTKKCGLQVVGDISCDIDGSIEITYKATMPDQPCFTYHAGSDRFVDTVEAEGVTVMAVDNLPCEFSHEASMDFSKALKPYINDILSADYSGDFDAIALPYPIKKALILHKGKLTREYTYINEFLKEVV